MTAFEEFGVMPELGAAVDEMGWTLPTDVQVGCSLFNSREMGFSAKEQIISTSD